MAVDPKTIFEATTKPVSDLLYDRGLGLYIPSYQRPYSWNQEKVDRLIEDISHGFKKLVSYDDSFTFLGTVITIHDVNHATIQPIVKDDVPSKVLTVIDGQQRMTTLLLLCIALHNELSIKHQQFLKLIDRIKKRYQEDQNTLDFGEDENQKVEEVIDALDWLEGKTVDVIADLALTFYEDYSRGDAPLYPRMIRSLEDSWSRDKNKCEYHSPVAHLIYTYIEAINSEDYKPIAFNPIKRTDENLEGEEALVNRFKQLRRILSKLNQNNSDFIDELPSYNEIYQSLVFQKSLLNNNTAPTNAINILNETDKAQFDDLAFMMFFANYVLSRVVVTVVKGKNEDYAFTIFESLNTTGEPLTAFETFKPRVVSSVSLENYKTSDEKVLMDEVSNYLSNFKAGDKLQKATKDLLINFFGAYSGKKVSGRLTEQRIELKNGFDDAKHSSVEKIRFIKTLRDCANFRNYFWETENFNNLHKFIGDRKLSDDSKLCLTFLSESNHTIVIPVLTNFFTQIIEAPTDEEKSERLEDFEEALKAVVAFSALWRAAKNGTAGIDNEYRELLSMPDMPTGLPAISRFNLKDNTIDIKIFKQELRSRLLDRKGNLKDKDGFIRSAISLPIYKKNTKVAKLLLLAAHHNKVEDDINPGYLIAAREATNNSLDYNAYKNEENFSLEHIAPQDGRNWDPSIYTNPTLIDTLGNLILISKSLNSSLAYRIWPEKQVLYSAVGAKTKKESDEILFKANRDHNISFRENTQKIADSQRYMPNLVTLGNINDKWNAEWIE